MVMLILGALGYWVQSRNDEAPWMAFVDLKFVMKKLLVTTTVDYEYVLYQQKCL